MASAAEQLARNVNFGSFAKAKDLHQRILFTLGILVVYRLGTFIPVPGLDPGLRQFFETQSGGMLGRTCQHVRWRCDRADGHFRAECHALYHRVDHHPDDDVGVSHPRKAQERGGIRAQADQPVYALHDARLRASCRVSASRSGLPASPGHRVPNWFFVLTGVVTFTGGTMLLMWMGEQITARGIGNGISLIIFAGIIAEMPKAIFNLLATARTTSVNVAFILLIVALVLALIVFIVFIERSQRRLLIQYPKRQAGNTMTQGQNSFLPLKINTSGVIPPIFAIAILMLPMTAVGFSGGTTPMPARWPQSGARLPGWQARFQPGSWTYIITYAVLVAFFCFFYTSIMFNPQDTADNLRKYGGFIPGIRPGKNTAAYIDYVLDSTDHDWCDLSGLRLYPPGAAPTILSGDSVLYRRHIPADRCVRDDGHGHPDPEHT